MPPTQADLQELRESVQDFARREIPEEVALKTDRENEFPNEMWRKFGEAGFLGITADEEFGGLAMGYQAHCVVMEELSRASGMFVFRILQSLGWEIRLGIVSDLDHCMVC